MTWCNVNPSSSSLYHLLHHTRRNPSQDYLSHFTCHAACFCLSGTIFSKQEINIYNVVRVSSTTQKTPMCQIRYQQMISYAVPLPCPYSAQSVYPVHRFIINLQFAILLFALFVDTSHSLAPFCMLWWCLTILNTS